MGPFGGIRVSPVDWSGAKLDKWFQMEAGTGKKAVAVALVSLGIATVVWSGRVGSTLFPRNVVAVEASTDAIEFRLAADWDLREEDAVAVQATRLKDLRYVSMSGVPRDTSREYTELEIPSRFATLVRLRLDSGSVVRVAHTGSGVEFETWGAPMSGTLRVTPRAVVVLSGEDGGRDSVRVDSDPATVTFRRDLNGAFSLFNLRDRDSLVMSQIPIDSIAFGQVTETERSRRLRFTSSIRSGTIVFADVADTIPLRRGAHVFLGGARKRFVADIRADTSVQLALKGKVRSVRVGPEPYQDNVAPRFLTYLQKYLQVFGGVVVTLVGLLWGLRRLK